MSCWEDLYYEIRTRFADKDEDAFEHMSEPLRSIMIACRQDLKDTFAASAWGKRGELEKTFLGSRSETALRLPIPEVEQFIEGARKIVWEAEFENGEWCIGENTVRYFLYKLLKK